MNKKFYALTCLIIASILTVHAQAPKAVTTMETFDAVSLPAGWTVVDTLSDTHTWEFVTVYPVAYTLDGTPFAIVNSDAAGSVPMSEQLISPTYDLSSNNQILIEFDMYFHYFGGGGSESANAEVWDGSTWVNLMSITSDMGGWGTPQHVTIDASAHKNANFKVRFYYKGANGDYWWAIDNVKIWDPQPNDVGIASLVTPSNGFGMSAEAISVSVKNYGTTAQTSIPVSYQVDGGAVVNETLNTSYTGFTTLAPGAEFTYTFTATYDFSAYQTYQIKTWTGLATDTDHENDTLYTSISNAPELVQNTYDYILNGTLGIESDGDFFWVSFYTTPGKFGKYSLSGTLLDTFRISSLAVGIRDLAYDPVSGHFFGGAGTPTIYELALDSVTPSLIGSVSTPSGASVRYIAYDHVRDGFWVGNLNGDIFLVDRTGALLNATGIVNPIASGTLTGLGNRYGLAFDDWSCPSEYLWIFSQPGTPSNVYLSQVDIYTGLPTGRSIDVTTQISFSGAVPAAGGLFTHPDIVAGTVSVGGLVTGATTDADPNMIFIMDLQALHPDQPMVINSVFPAPDSTNIQFGNVIELIINEPFVVNDTALIVITDGTTPVIIDSVTVSGDTLRIYHQDFSGETTYTVHFFAGALTGLCSDNTDFSWSFTTGVTGFTEAASGSVSLFPNPANNSIIVDGAEGAVLKIFTLTGNCVLEQLLTEQNQQINTSNLVEGMYVIEIAAEGIRQLQKLVISR
ncbi:MAG TPA: T9SS type A sorting domain-containing protein [Bacteroidales bacterium]|nr:T9SS type A sorting domain-containing protein [Bacteroidales bacterium]